MASNCMMSYHTYGRYFVAAIVNASSLPGVDGTFTDDSAGAGTEHSTLGTILNISNATIAEIAFATQAGGNYLATVLAANGKTCFDCVGGTSTRNACRPVLFIAHYYKLCLYIYIIERWTVLVTVLVLESDIVRDES